VFVFYIGNSTSVVPIFFCYILGGVGIGSFEANLISCITPLGHETKKWAIMGMPLGYNGTTIGAFLLFLAAPHSRVLEGIVFGFVGIMNVFGIVYLHYRVPDVPFEASSDDAKKFVRSLWTVKEWLPLYWMNCVAMCFNMFGVILMSSIVLYIFDVPDVPLVPRSTVTLPRDAFQAIYNFCGFSGDFIARRLAYNPRFPRFIGRYPLVALVLTFLGIFFGVTKVCFLGWMGMFLVMFGNGTIYGATTKHVDDVIPRTFNLVALSVWLFIGDAGSFVASMLTNVVTVAVGTVPLAANGTSTHG